MHIALRSIKEQGGSSRNLLRNCRHVLATLLPSSLWGSFGILENVYKCFKILTEMKHPWKYYQGIHPPVPLYKSAMSVAIPRRAARFMLQSRKVEALLNYLSQTWVPDESFWTTVAGNAVLMKVPGSYRARDILWLRKHLFMTPPTTNSVDNIGTSYIGRYQVWEWQKPCRGRIISWSCVFGVLDVPEVVKRPELVVHKVYLDTEPAAFICLLKEVRKRAHNPVDFDARSYAEMPTVELSNGKRITELKHPEWLMRSSFYRPDPLINFCDYLKSAEFSYVTGTPVETINLNCDTVFNGGPDLIKYKRWTFKYSAIEKDLYESADTCDTIRRYFIFEDAPLSEEEANYPLAYGFLIYKDIVQVMLELSIFYHPQNAYCIMVDQGASREFKNFITKLPSCFNNTATFYLSGADLPLRTNLEMVRIMNALNGSINTDVEEFEIDRYRMMEVVLCIDNGIHPPVPLYKSAMSVAIPRKAANFMSKSKKVKALLTYLNETWVPDESFWTTVAGNAVLIRAPGSFRARDILWLRKHLTMTPTNYQSVEHVGTSYIGRYQVWEWQKPCGGRIASWSCVFGVRDMKEVVRRPELVAHKLYLDQEPAAYLCLLKEIRRRSYSPTDFDATSYAEMPTVELSNGKRITELKHPDWLMRSSFYRR
ncbi:Core-2/I-Branching enzyme [Ostertagia ostertagi]